MRVLCAISGIDFKCEHIPLYLTEREYHHPIFSLRIPRLLELAPKYLEGKFSHTENYLYYLSLFNSTGLIEFRVPAVQTEHTQSIIAHNIQKLLVMVELINHIGFEKARTTLSLPQLVITPDTKDLANSKYWIQIWEQNYNDYTTGYKTSTLIEKLSRKESQLERLIKDKTKDISSYAHQLAEWASLAGEFPQYEAGLTPDILGGKQMSLADYWKHIIKSCARGEAIFEIPDADVNELIEHCEEYIEHGSIFAATLMTLLRDGASRKNRYFNLGDIDIGTSGTIYRILDADASIEDANKLALIDSAPVERPVESQYPNKLAYIRAKLKWDMAQEYKKSNELRNEMNKTDTSQDGDTK